MSNLKYGVMWEDENALVWGFAVSPEAAMEAYSKETGVSVEELTENGAYYSRSFTDEEAKESESWPEI